MELLVIALGACIGSFLTALTYRLPKKLGILRGRSICPHCKTKIAWYDNVPVVSYFILKGRCRTCGKKISFRYPLIEIGATLLFLAFFLSIANCPNAGTLGILCLWKTNFGLLSYLFSGVIISILVAIFVIDLEKKIIPDELIFFGLLFVFSFLFFTNPEAIFKNLLVGFLTGAFFLAIHLLTRGRGMGLGDVKFVIFGGFILGWPLTIVWLFISFTAGAIIGVILILLKKAKFGREIAFGPYLTGALITTILLGEKLLELYK